MSRIDNFMFLFSRRRQTACIRSTLCMAFLFVIYQWLMHYAVSNDHHPSKKIDHVLEKIQKIRGTHVKEITFYSPVNGKFTCFRSGEVIDFEKVNDNYCDCVDSSDEPGTNACPDGTFYCPNVSNDKKYPKMVPSSKVNDGICDCCDGSEEYDNNNIMNVGGFERNLRSMIKHVPCPNMCR